MDRNDPFDVFQFKIPKFQFQLQFSNDHSTPGENIYPPEVNTFHSLEERGDEHGIGKA
jgi:hypothetical protein